MHDSLGIDVHAPGMRLCEDADTSTGRSPLTHLPELVGCLAGCCLGLCRRRAGWTRTQKTRHQGAAHAGIVVDLRRDPAFGLGILAGKLLFRLTIYDVILLLALQPSSPKNK